jgi:chorismate synthase
MGLMASNSFGKILTITTWGESHGPAIGVVIDGCPAGLPLTVEVIDRALAKRAPGRHALTSPRREADRAQILSGVFEGYTTGTPITIAIANTDANSNAYLPIKDILRPGHANYSYLQKYGIYDWRGGGRASARETACRVAAGAVAQLILDCCGITAIAYLQQVGSVTTTPSHDLQLLRSSIDNSALFCPNIDDEMAIASAIAEAKECGDSIGGVVAFITSPLPVGLGDPIYEKLEARMAYAMMGLPASKGFEIGEGFAVASMRGSAHNDSFSCSSNGKPAMTTNHSGGTLGGISNGMPLYGRVAFKPAASIKIPQATTTLTGNATTLEMAENFRHDPCVAVRAVPVVEAMVTLVLADALLMQCSSNLKKHTESKHARHTIDATHQY